MASIGRRAPPHGRVHALAEPRGRFRVQVWGLTDPEPQVLWERDDQQVTIDVSAGRAVVTLAPLPVPSPVEEERWPW